MSSELYQAAINSDYENHLRTYVMINLFSGYHARLLIVRCVSIGNTSIH